jgi:sugar (pentulose or hexulose) kinase
MISIDDVSKVVEANHTFEPNPKHRAMYDEMFAHLLEIYAKNKPIWGKMHK